MKLLILGATGPTGIHLVRLAVKAGHETTAIIRDRTKITQKNDLLTVITPDILNIEEMTFAIARQDCVVSALGGGRDLHSTIVSRAMAVLIPAMQRAEVNRVVFLSSFGVGFTNKRAKPLSRLFFSTFLKHVLADKEKADELLRSSQLDYTLVYPTRLTKGDYTGHYRFGLDLKVGWFPKISRADVADFMLTLAEKHLWSRQTVIVTG